GLEAAGYGGDDGGLVVGDPVGAVVEIELHRLGGGEVERDVGAVELGVQAIVHVPRIVERRLVLPVAGRDVEGALPDAVGVVEAEMGGGAGGLPVVGAAELGLQTAGHRHAVRLRHRAAGGHGQDVGVRVVGEDRRGA